LGQRSKYSSSDLSLRITKAGGQCEVQGGAEVCEGAAPYNLRVLKEASRRVRYESFIYPIVTSIPGLPSISKARKHSSSGWGLPKPCILDNSTRRRGLPRWYSRVRGKKRARAVVETVWVEANAGYDNEIPAVSRSP
jgi:hypothetical protein